MKLTIDNFQAIKHAELDFPVGITTITGPNSSGKSSILRAVSFFAKNSAKKRHIKHGEKEFNVCIEVDGNTFSWKKGKSSAVFSRNNQSIEKVGTKTPHNFFPDFPMKLDDNGNVLQMSGEWEPLFPYDRTDSELFALFEDIFNISNSSVVLDEIRNDIRTKKASKESLVEAYNDLVPKVNTLDQINFDEIRDKTSSMIKESRVCLSGVPTEAETSLCNKAEVLLDIPMPDMFKKEIPEFDITAISDSISFIERVSPFCSHSENLNKTEFDFSSIAYALEIDASLEKVESLEKNLQIIGKIHQATINFDYPEQLEKDLFLCDNWINEYNSLAKDEEQLSNERELLNKKLSEVKSCPLCGSKL